MGYRPITKLERCVKNAFNKAAEPPYQAEALSSILFPIFGTGPGRGNFEEHVERCFSAAIEAMESEPAHPIRVAYFYVWSDADLEICLSLARNHSGLQARLSSGPVAMDDRSFKLEIDHGAKANVYLAACADVPWELVASLDAAGLRVIGDLPGLPLDENRIRRIITAARR